MRSITTSALSVLAALAIAWPVFAQEEKTELKIDVTGDWEITSESPRGTQTSRVTFKQDGEKLTGTMEARMGSVDIKRGSVKGNQISFSVEMGRGTRTFTMTYTGTIEGFTAAGTMTNPRGGSTSWTATKLAGDG
jgi:hypothetical protein